MANANANKITPRSSSQKTPNQLQWRHLKAVGRGKVADNPGRQKSLSYVSKISSNSPKVHERFPRSHHNHPSFEIWTGYLKAKEEEDL
jgi:hypothetical protein